MTTDRYDVFLSYARADDAGADSAAYDDPARSFMRRLYAALTDAGLRVWWDKVDMPSRGETFSAEIERAIRACDRFVLVCGAGAAASDYVRAEWRCAFDACLSITPILRSGDYPLIPPEVALFHAIDFRPPRAEAAATADLLARLRQPARVGQVIGALKPLPDAYVPREAPYAAAREALIADAITPTVISAPPRAAAIYGMGGIGKSTLARALAEDCQIRRRYVDDVLWLEVGQTPTLPALQAAVGVHFGDSRDNYPDEKTGTVRLSQVLHGRQALIVLDDVWDAGVVKYFPTGDTACRLLITTRSGALAGRVQGADIRLNALTPEEGARLIAGRTGQGDASDPTCRAISERLGGHTLAVALAAAQIAEGYADDAADMLRLIEKRFAGADPFADLKLDETDKDANVAVSLGLSYDALPGDDVRRRFRALGVFARAGTFDRAALAAVWGDADADDARAPLAALRGAGLIEDAADGRFALHALIHAYARALLNAAGESEQVSARHFAHYAAQHGADRDHTDIDYLRGITPDFDNLQAALNWGLMQHQPREAVDLLNALGNYLVLYQPHSVYRALLETGLGAAQRIGYVQGEANTLLALGDLSVLQDELDAARACYDRALPVYEQIGARLGLANTLLALGDLSVLQDELDAARACYDRALPVYEQIGARLGLANTLRALGDLSVRQAELDAARACYDRALPVYEQIGARLGLANTLKALGDLSVLQAELDAARACYDRALPVYEQIGDRLGLANTLLALGDLSVRQAELDAARACYDRALPVYEQIGARLGLANTLKALGDLSVRQAELDAARACYDRALPVYEQIGARLGLANTLKVLGDLSVRQAELDAARACYDRALPVYEQIGDRLGLANTLLALGDLSVRQDELDAARACYDRALPVYEQIGARLGLANTLLALGDLSVLQAELDAARACYDRALPVYEQIGDRLGLANTLKALGDLSVRQAELDAARACYDRALPVYEQIGARLGLANTLLALGDLSVRQDELDAARACYDRALPVYEQIGDRLGLANTLKALGDLSVLQAELDAARAYFNQALALYQVIGESVGQMNTLIGMARMARDADQDTAAAKRHFEAVFAIADRIPAYRDHPVTVGLRREYAALDAPPDRQAEAMAALLALYRQGGEAAVRAALKDVDVPDEVMAALLAQLAQAAAGAEQGGVSTLPAETVQMFAGNTVAVRTGVPDMLDAWRDRLTAARADWVGRGEDYAIEVAFADALLAILDGARPALPPDNPYADVVRQVIAAIDG